jgi:hypothetical protein
MSMAADRQYLALSHHIAMSEQDRTIAPKPQAKIASVAGKRVLTMMRKLTVAMMATILLAGAVIARGAQMKTYPAQTAPYLPIQILGPVW